MSADVEVADVEVARALLRLIREQAVEGFRVRGIEPTQEQIADMATLAWAGLIAKMFEVATPEDRAELEAIGVEIVRDAGFDMGPRN